MGKQKRLQDSINQRTQGSMYDANNDFQLGDDFLEAIQSPGGALQEENAKLQEENQQLLSANVAIQEEMVRLKTNVENALVPTGDGAIQFGAFFLTRRGIQSAEKVDVNEWTRLGSVLFRLEQSIQWLIGDWILYGEYAYGKTYEQIAQETGYEKTSLYQYKYVSEKVDFSIRIENLSFGHHQLVAGKSKQEQATWLQRAETEKWSVARLRAEINAMPSLPATLRPLTDKANKLRFSRVWRALESGKPVNADDVRLLRDWLNRIEDTMG